MLLKRSQAQKTNLDEVQEQAELVYEVEVWYSLGLCGESVGISLLELP